MCVFSPVSRVTYLGVDVDLARAAAGVRPDVLGAVRLAVLLCSASAPLTWRQRLAGYVNFVAPLSEASVREPSDS